MRIRKISLGLFAAAALAACDNPLDTNPTASIPSGEALDTPEEVRVAVNGMYDAYSVGDLDRNLLVFPDLYSDNFGFQDTYTSDEEVSIKTIRSTNTGVRDIWEGAYVGINRANNVLAALDGVDGLDEDEAAQYRGEALYVRAHLYFVLAEFFGGVPLVTEPTLAVSAGNNVPRSTEAQTYALVETDLREAQRLLLNNSPSRRGRATWGSATALLARVNLYARDWADARTFASQVIGSGDYELVDYGDIWNEKNSDESIFELQYTVNDPGPFAGWFLPDTEGGRGSFVASQSLRSIYGDAVEDRELDSRYLVTFLNGSQFIGKYFRISNGDDNYVMLRLAEMYLIRSEAEARLDGNLAQARADIDAVRERAGLAPLDAEAVVSAQQVLRANLQERRREFVGEGYRFFDLRRFRDALPEIGTLVRDQYRADFRLYFPLPQGDLDANPELTQNPGY
ncbi:RagB/SusD family nutrient uptake outer membrane protein [Longimicrobium terrae]|uniref:RagB/SusD family nutrient uptake outer membrane protein n=1 Tax=Longimicrobium terrae TaxID=1639882 RepID=A0A841H115_9BACT|nr:RagB/SusD family nutrient uptake outer membrane protein [Longimicrobium terrae]MBB4637094.1 hypothetical protein [Longimicrobium terrae]MBB6071646.1 hypothetical protein [Longimicrobium terrae]NNC29938.1 RagB/SusD family nutrient uptake outer membrane protein [Longimicrobium terrae]